MNVAHLIGTNFFGGPERQILSHAQRVRAYGVTPQILSFAENGRSNELLCRAADDGIACRELDQRSPFHPGAVTELAGFMKSLGTDLLVGHGYKANVVGRLATWRTGIPFLAVSRGWTAESRRIRFYEFLDRQFLRLADAVVAVSQGQRQKVLACRVRPDKVRVIHNAIDLGAYPGPAEKSMRAELGIPRDAIVVATAGRLSPEKNHLGLIQAAKRVISENPHVYFVVFGEGFMRPELEKAVADSGMVHRFFLPGYRRDVRSLLHESDIFVLPSHTEGLPNVVLEAFACRKPVVATSVGGTPEVVRHGLDGLLVPPGAMEEFGQCIFELAADAELRLRMGTSGYEHVRMAFDFATQTASYLELYESLHALEGQPVRSRG